MNTLPCELKSLITDFMFSKTESYNQQLPDKAASEAKKDLNDLHALRVLCDGGSTFIAGRFKSSSIKKTRDYIAFTQARRALVACILRFRHAHLKWFETPKLKTSRLCFTRFVERNIDNFSVESFCKHDACLTELNSKITALRLKQRLLLKNAKRATGH